MFIFVSSTSLYRYLKLLTPVEAETPKLWPSHVKSWLFGKDPDAGKGWGQEEKGTTEDEMVGWHHRLNGHGFGWTPGVGDRQGSLACCIAVAKSRTRLSDWTELNWMRTDSELALGGRRHCVVSYLVVTSARWCRSSVSLDADKNVSSLSLRVFFARYNIISMAAIFCWIPEIYYYHFIKGHYWKVLR